MVGVDYAYPWDRVLTGFKFGARVEWAGVLAQVLARAAAHAAPVDLVLCVPLSRQRLAQRGYNQAWELARRTARSMGLPARSDVLQRAVDLPGQAEQGRAQRLQRLRGVFQVNSAARAAVVGRRVALVDDVLTTGATMAEAVDTLRAAGAAFVSAWALARTPAPPDEPS